MESSTTLKHDQGSHSAGRVVAGSRPELSKQVNRGAVLACIFALGIGVNVAVFSLSTPEHGLREIGPTPAKLLNFVRIPTYADLREVEPEHFVACHLYGEQG